jgi:hypothetical protein
MEISFICCFDSFSANVLELFGTLGSSFFEKLESSILKDVFVNVFGRSSSRLSCCPIDLMPDSFRLSISKGWRLLLFLLNRQSFDLNIMLSKKDLRTKSGVSDLSSSPVGSRTKSVSSATMIFELFFDNVHYENFKTENENASQIVNRLDDTFSVGTVNLSRSVWPRRNIDFVWN